MLESLNKLEAGRENSHLYVIINKYTIIFY